MPRKYNRYWIAALLAAWTADFLFFNKQLGVSLFIWFLMLIGGGLLVARLEGIRLPAASYILAVVILVFSAVPIFRREPFTDVLAVLLALGLTMILAGTAVNGYWTRFHEFDYLKTFFLLVGGAISRPFQMRPTAVEGSGSSPETPMRRPWRKTLGPIILGLILALPVIAVLAALLASADPIFAENFKALFNLVSLDRIGEYFVRGMYILVLAFLFTGALLHALLPRQAATPPDPDKPYLKPFLGFTETSIILGSVDALFIFFLAIQFRYFFGGQANINNSGFTYAEYARRGFSELVLVALISLGLYLVLERAGRRENIAQRRGFSFLTVGLIVLVLVILVSAMQRLVLYEQAYGFTRLRVQTLIFIPWLALLLLATAVLEIVKRSGRFALVALAVVTGFCLTFPIINMDALIVRLNVQRAVAGEDLDRAYLLNLSSDAVPEEYTWFQRSDLPKVVHDQLGANLACQSKDLNATALPWMSFTFSNARATQVLSGQQAAWADFPVTQQDGTFMVGVNGETEDCFSYTYMD